MLQRLALSILMLAATAAAEDSLHVFYYSGESIERITNNRVTITLSLKNTGKLNQVAVFVDNNSADAVNVIPSNFVLHQNAPKDEDLKLKSDEEVQKIGGRSALGHVMTGVRTGISRADDKLAGREVETAASTTPADFEEQERWLAHADELAEHGQMSAIGRSYLRGSTVFPGTRISGVLWFDRDESSTSALVRVVLGARSYEFPFPPPASATTPSNPNQADQATGQPTSTQQSSQPHAGSGGSSAKAGVLGISGENWVDGGIAGVKILEVSHNGSAELAGLTAGCVITEVDASRVHTTEELAATLAKYGPGSRVSITYLIRTNLGWMPKVTAVMLGRED